MALVDDIVRFAKNSAIRSYRWADRGVAPIGYITGMAVAYAQAVKDLTTNTPGAIVMAQPIGTSDGDVLKHYEPDIDRLGASVATPQERLRLLFAVMLGLGMRESSGKYCEGRDRSANNVSAATAEAGLFQTSYNSVSNSPVLAGVIAKYSGRDDLAAIFAQGVHCSPASWLSYGTGPGFDYQELAKHCPAFAVEYTAVALRLKRKHWGPINRKAAELRLDSIRLFAGVEDLVAGAGAGSLLQGVAAPTQHSQTVKALVGLANGEWEFFGGSTRSLSDEWVIVGDEQNEPYSSRVARYWRAVGNTTASGTTDKPWSAAFISWLFQSAGVAEDIFEPRDGHFDYIRSIVGRNRNDLRLLDPRNTPLAVGDLI